MDVPFFDLTRQYDAIRSDIEAAVREVLASQQCIGGPRVAGLEEQLADRIGVDHAIGVSSGTDALLVSMMALGFEEGDEVVTSPFSFFSPVESLLRCGARPVFVDIDPETFNLDTDRLDDAVGDDTRAILPVHLFGQTCDMTAIDDIAEAHDLEVVEDMAQAIGAEHRGRPAGGFGTTGCLSFYPTKNLGGAGDGGMVFCDDATLADHIRRLTNHGAEPKYHHLEVGGNFRLDALQAAILQVKLDHLEAWNDARRDHAAFYDERLGDLDEVRTPKVPDANTPVYHQYTIRARDRDDLREYLSHRGVGTNVYYPEPLHTQPVFDEYGWEPADFPEARRACREVLSLPVFPELTDEERSRVVEAIRGFYRA